MNTTGVISGGGDRELDGLGGGKLAMEVVQQGKLVSLYLYASIILFQSLLFIYSYHLFYSTILLNLNDADGFAHRDGGGGGVGDRGRQR